MYKVLPAAFILSQSAALDWLSLSRVAWHSDVFKHTGTSSSLAQYPAACQNHARSTHNICPPPPVFLNTIRRTKRPQRTCPHTAVPPARPHSTDGACWVQRLHPTAAKHYSTSLQSGVAAGCRGAPSLHPAHSPNRRRCTLWQDTVPLWFHQSQKKKKKKHDMPQLSSSTTDEKRFSCLGWIERSCWVKSWGSFLVYHHPGWSWTLLNNNMQIPGALTLFAEAPVELCIECMSNSTFNNCYTSSRFHKI